MVYSFCRQLFRKEPHEGKTVTARALRITGDITSDITGDITSSVILREQNVVWSVAISGQRPAISDQATIQRG